MTARSSKIMKELELDSFVDDTMSNSKNGLVRISYLEPGKEILGS